MRIEITPRSSESSDKNAKRERKAPPKSREGETRDRQELLTLLEAENLSPEEGLNLLASYPEKKTRAQDIESGIRKIDVLWESLAQATSPEETKEKLRDVMMQMAGVAREVPPEKEGNEPYWESVYARFRSVADVKKSLESEDLRKAFEEVFQEYEGFLEEEFFERSLRDKLKETSFASGEELMSEFFGRTPEEMERLKARNRKDVVKFMEEHANDEPTVGMLEELHRRNNKGIVPASFSKIREKGDEVTYGSGRVGTFGEDVREELEHVMARAEWLRARNPSKTVYSISIAKLHNDILDIHPFLDRNGSTTLLFAELMMSREGYKPEVKREAGYYNQVRKILANNPVAVAVLGGGQYEIGNMAGYYKGATTKGKEALYKKRLEEAAREA